MSFKKVPFLEVVKDITGGNRKFLASEYSLNGKYPIIDQGDKFIGGYTNENALVKKTEPVVIFGDHTKKLKFIDFDFCIGADGVKILQSSDNLLPKYLYYYLQTVDLPTVGYSRHYKFLKETRVPLPPLHIQKQIADVLDKADALRQKDQLLLQKYDELAQSIFYDMFGDPVKNEKGWDKITLKQVCENIQIGPFGTQLHVEDYITGGIPLVNPTHIINQKIVPNNKLTITPEKHSLLSNYHLQIDDIIMGRRGEMGRCALVSEKEQSWLCGTGSLFLRLKQKEGALFLMHQLATTSYKKQIESVAKGITMMNLNTKVVSNLQVIDPPLILQKKYKESIEHTLNLHLCAIKSLEQSSLLFNSLINNSFYSVQTL